MKKPKKVVASKKGTRPPAKKLLSNIKVAWVMATVGDTVTIDFPHHHDHNSYVFHENYHGKEGRITRIQKKGGVDVKVTAEKVVFPKKAAMDIKIIDEDVILKNLHPGILIFHGQFTKK